MTGISGGALGACNVPTAGTATGYVLRMCEREGYVGEMPHDKGPPGALRHNRRKSTIVCLLYDVSVCVCVR